MGAKPPPGEWGPVDRKYWSNIPGRIVSKSLMACETGAWSLLSYPRDPFGNPDLAGAPEFSLFRCGSWRCRRCGPRVGASDFVRVACASKARPDWFYLVLTVKQEDFVDRWDAFSSIYRLWQNRLRKRIQRFADSYAPGKLEYVMTFERHTKSGWPHVNILLGHPGLRAASDSLGTEIRRKGIYRNGRICHKPEWRSLLVNMVKKSGFGEIVWVEDVQNPEAWAGYITKLAKELVGAEVKDQTPYGAPQGFRRIRATRGTLPPTFATLKKQAGGRGPRAWAMTSKTSFRQWHGLEEESRLKRANVEFRTNTKEGWMPPVWNPAYELLQTMQTAMRGKETDWNSLIEGWQNLEVIKAWNKDRDASAKAEATRN